MKRIARSHDRREVIKQGPKANPGTRHDRSRGQVLVIFAGAAFVLMALMALVVDVSWYWANTLKVQRAADAAALAGAVWLPGQPDCATGACFVARQEAAKNGYTNGSGGVTVAATQDTGDPRQLDVQVSAPVSTFFMRAVGISSINATRASKGLYVLPVPMGSPLAYYGVGDFYVNTGNPPVVSVAPFVPKSASGSWSGSWTNPDHAWLNGSGSSYHTTSSTDNQGQAWSTLNFNTGAITGTISGVVVSFTANVAFGNACQVEAAVSWNNGSNWGNQTQTTANLSTTDTAFSLGSSGDPQAWDSGHTWVPGDFANGSFRVQLRYHMNSCGTLSLNQLTVTVYSNSIQKVLVKDPNNTVLPSLGAWGAIITRGGNQQNGDAYAPANNGGSPYSGPNTLYNGTATNGGGYEYAIKLPAGGKVDIFDPGFCAMGGNPSGAGNLGAGDHWIGAAGTAVSTYYTLWNTNGLLGLDPSSWGAPVYSSGSLFDGQHGYDPVNGSSPGGGATSGCDAYHNAWYTLPTGTLAAGTYALQVSTTNPADSTDNAGTSAENMFAIEAIGGADAGGNSPAIYGNGKMAVYNNLQPGNSFQLFYLAKIDRNAGAGKTALIDIFDPGDVPGDATLKVLSPDGGVQTQATFSYTTDGNCNTTVIANGWTASDLCSDSNVSSITTSIGGHSSFNNTWIHIRIPLPASYGLNGLWQGGWWQIRYETPGGGNDTTTWQVSISGNPVHLTVP
jgi:Flp pilus assembly protein TadG